MHARVVAVWDVPTAIECGTAFRCKVGVKCEADCRAQGWRIEILDSDGLRLADAEVGDEPWAGTSALYCAEIGLRAPVAEGLYAWRAVVAVDEGEAEDSDDSSHAEAQADFNVRVVRPSDCTLKVIAIDRARQTPVAGARVVAHPYRAVTDERGVAELRLPRGSYRVFVSGRDYFPYRADGDLQTDTTIEAELQIDRGPSDAELWS